MSNMTSESEERIVTNGYIDSPSIEEVNSGGNGQGGVSLKKGPWTSQEDAVLVEYVRKHGEGNWNAVQKYSGLSRCGKSCRLRWANHLRPDLKKGAFTPNEERRIIELHAKMGNKWARMAAELPGRTDNEIKNFWNTRIKRRQRAGLPIYPPDICLQSLNENNPNQNTGTFSAGNTSLHPELLPDNNLEIPSVEFKSLELNQQLYPSFLDIPTNSLLTQGLSSVSCNNFQFSTMHPAKRLRDSEISLSGFSGVVSDVLPGFNQDSDDGCWKIARSFATSYDNNVSSSCLLPGSHSFSNGNSSSSSKSISWAMKMELPSLQYSDTQMVGSCGTPSPLPSLECVDTMIQTPRAEWTQSDNLCRWNNGLLESVLYESHALKNARNNFCQLNTSDGADNSSQLHDADWDVSADPNSPLGQSVASVFNDCTPISESSLDEPQLVKTLPVKQEELEWVSITHCDDASGTPLGEDFSTHRKHIGDAADSSQGCSHGSRGWDDTSTTYLPNF